MKRSNKLIDDVVAEAAGADVLPLVKLLKNRKNVSEFKLASGLKKDINPTRNMLYRLYNANLVSFVRRKDKVKGWYIYYWTFNGKRIKQLTANIKNKKLDKLKERLEREKSSNFFICENKCIRLDFDQATDFGYKCPECGALLHQEDNVKKIADLEKDIAQLEKELKKKKSI
jgi:transcription initiation factor TFIIE subunit alpha